MQILFSVMMATFMVVMVPRAAVSADRISEVLGTETSVRPPERAVEPDVRSGDVVLDGVDFSYPGASDPVLCGVSLHARRARPPPSSGRPGPARPPCSR